MAKRRKDESGDKEEGERELRTPVAEQLLIDEIPAIGERKILCMSLGRGQFAATMAAEHADAQVTCHFLDIYLADEARHFAGAGEGGAKIVCAADFPDEEFDLLAIPVDPRGDAELTRDLLQAGHQRLSLGGRMISATSLRDDQWLHEELRKLFPKVTRRPSKSGVLYLATKTGPLKKVKNFECEFAFRDGERLIRAISRPGVFSHRSLDTGARMLMNTMTVRDGNRVLDIGCGCGAVSLAAAFRAKEVTVVALDSHARAIECTQRNASLNNLNNITAVLNADGDCGETGTFDLAVGNPPYYSDFRIAEIFLQAAAKALKPGGQVLIVTKAREWLDQRFPQLFDVVEVLPQKGHFLVFSGKNR